MSDKHLELSIDRTTRFGRHYQMSISLLDEDGKGHGYRLLGPKYLGDSELVAKTTLDRRDADEIRRFLDEVFPIETTEATS